MTCVLVVAPHPDDEVMGCGGVMARHATYGDEVHVCIVTCGVPKLATPKLIQTVREELDEAHRILGVGRVRYLDFPAATLNVVPGHELTNAIGDVIQSVRPTIVYLPHRGDIHADHSAVYLATLVAARPINACSVRKLLCYETLSETEWAPPTGDNAFVPTVFVDISDFLERKLQAMSCYRSQLKEPPHSRSLSSMKALARLRGGTVGVEAAEAFSLVRETILGRHGT